MSMTDQRFSSRPTIAVGNSWCGRRRSGFADKAPACYAVHTRRYARRLASKRIPQDSTPVHKLENDTHVIAGVVE